jgi:sulfhydrogenase subunit beta (sulfur reductase)
MEHAIYRFPRAQLDALIERLQREYRVLAPVAKGDVHAWDEVRPGVPIALAYPTTMLPPRQCVAPQRETLFRFTREKDAYRFEAPPVERPLALVGVHGCDLTGLRVLRSFHESSCRDRVVTDRLDRSFIIGLACWVPCLAETFCRDMGSLDNEIPADLYLWDLGELLLLKVIKPRGREMLAGVGPLETATAEELVSLRRRVRARHDAFPLHFKFPPAKLSVALEAAESDILWEANADRCLSCGRCNIVCPTCTCFDVQDVAVLDGSSGERYRTWHGCQIPGFAKVAGGHDFRPSRTQQLRYRIFRKGKYMPERYGMVGCTGCGRCHKHCPTHISIRDIFRQVGGPA